MPPAGPVCAPRSCPHTEYIRRRCPSIYLGYTNVISRRYAGWSTAQGHRCAREHQFPLVALTGLRTGCSLPASVPPLSLRAWHGILYQGAT